jgi:predicted alpha/beta-fold hydrolase
MPLLPSTYRAPIGFGNGHIQSIAAGFLRPDYAVAYERERIDLADGDFLDLDWSRAGRDRLAVISYGMESDSRGRYVLGMVQALNDAGWDALVWNYRSCGGEPNRKVHFYHGGLVDDLHAVIIHALAGKPYAAIDLVGFSLGGNLTLNYLGRRGTNLVPPLRRAVAISAPTDVEDCALQLRKFPHRIYSKLFLRAFRRRIRAKMKAMPGLIDDLAFADIRTLEDYDIRYTVPHFGFASVPDLYRSVSSRYVIGNIALPTLLISAKDDPFMGAPSFPIEAAQAKPNLFLEMPDDGGHLGFISFPRREPWWMERRVVAFLRAA